ncbi:MAG: AAA family ATPase [Muribaculum sp.]|nr:AAA family ATPase [Muribaculaceae bacterium]MCM1081682.1 AAA family ATPase [Muribaculum sp.]
MTTREFAHTILSQLPYEPTSQQVEVIAALARFCSQHTPQESVFLLNGYAGTGKTSLCAALVKALGGVGIGTVLLAPTGRAAKVFAAFAQHPAYTIHRRIYSSAGNGFTSSRTLKMAENRSHNCVFIVDEASMIGGDSSSGNLLEDLVHYVYSGINCRMILLGDTAQLPPVGCDSSPAMNPTVLHSMGLRVTRATMTATVRQASDSGILYNATWLRRAMRHSPLPEPLLRVSPFRDIDVLESETLADSIEKAYSSQGILNTIIITRSNARAADFNRAVRSVILNAEEELIPGEVLLIGKNNYFWARQQKQIDFLANGDMAVIDCVYGTEFRYDHRFADVRLTLPDREISFDCKILLSTLLSDMPAMTNSETIAMFDAIVADPELADPDDADPKQLSLAKRSSLAINSPYLNALQVKYGYAVTCHKAQGGQWTDVYVDLSYIPAEAMGIEFYRWLYTSVTRATTRLHLISPTVEVR